LFAETAMNETAASNESELILRRLNDPFPPDLELLGLNLQYPVLGLLILAALGGIGIFYWLEQKSLGLWAYYTSLVRFISLAFLSLATVFPRAEISLLQSFGENVAWYAFVIAALLYGHSFVVASYVRDSKAIGWWSLLLGFLRTLVYLILAVAFMLPAIQKWDNSEKHSRVLIVIDVSPSVSQTSDDILGGSVLKPQTRLQKVLDYLTNDQVNFLTKLLEKNPLFVYRFASRLDEEPQMFEQGKPTGWTSEDFQAWAKYDFKPYALRGVSKDGQESIKKTAGWKGNEPGNAEWATTWAKLPESEALPSDLTEDDKVAAKDNRVKLEKRVDVARSIMLGTNVPESLVAVTNREAANMVKAIIVVSDGRSNLGSESAYKQFRERAVRENIPVFTIGVGEARDTVSIAITEIQAPDRAPPDEEFKIVVEADAVGLGDTEVTVELDLYMPGKDPKKGDQKDHTLSATMKFQGETTPPHGTAEFVINPEKLPDTLTEESKKVGKRRQMKEGQWSAIARIARDKREIFSEPYHVSPTRSFQVIDRPLRILMFGGATREFQTLRTLIVREVQQNRAELSICLQSEGGRAGTAVQDVPPERLLTRFPDRLDTTKKPTDKPEDKYYNLDEYDLVIAFDPDWTEKDAAGNFRIADQHIKNLQNWVDNLGGGLIYVAGPINTYQLARAEETGRLKPLLDVMPVVPEDIILFTSRGVPRNPRRLTLKPNPEFDVLKLTADDSEDPIGGWEAFFTGRDKYVPDPDVRKNLNPTKGMYAYYPVKLTKPGSSTLIEFLSVSEQGQSEPKPWLVTTQPSRGRSVFLGSGEIWRLRAYDQDFYDRFWIKLSRYAASNRDARAARGRVLVGKEFTSGSQVRVQARLLAPNGEPYEMNAQSPKFTIVQMKADDDTKVKELGPFELKARKSGSEFDGYYGGLIQADATRFPPGAEYRYRVVVEVPESPGDKLTGDFILKQSDPELDNTRPDYAALEQAAGTLDQVAVNIKNASTLEKLKGSETDPKKVKLAFRLSNPEKVALIPECIDSKVSSQRNRGAVEDIWDKGPSLVRDPDTNTVSFSWFSTDKNRQVFDMSYLLLTTVLLLSTEWLIRKLLRLA